MKLPFASLMVAALVAAGSLSAQPQSKSGDIQQTPVRRLTVYDGNWWLNAEAKTRSGFLDGIADYLIATGVKWPAGSSHSGDEKITEYYKRDPRNRSLLVPDVWRRVLTESPPPLPGGEVYEGRHGYYLADWYKMNSYEERLGYLEGYLWCLRTYGRQPAAAYPRSLDYYDEQIWNYIDAHKAYEEPVADILARFRSAVPN